MMGEANKHPGNSNVVSCVCSLSSTHLPGGNPGYPHYTDEKTEPREVKDLAQGHSAAKWKGQDLHVGCLSPQGLSWPL